MEEWKRVQVEEVVKKNDVVVVMAEAFHRRRLEDNFSIPQSTHFKASRVMEHLSS